jgi:multicomponent Na+:H+ antiporter subunit C
MKAKERTDMLLIFALTIGIIITCAVYLMLRRSMVRLIIGLSLLTYAVNLLIFTAGDLRRRAAPIVDQSPPDQMADPLVQALILTAIVISFGVLAFTLALAYRASQAVGSDDLDALQSTDCEV